MMPGERPEPPRGATLAVSECVHCGFCLDVCPTYEVLGTEMDSPRGRLYLMKALEEGRLDPGAALVRHLDLCLGCRACETGCPSGVLFGVRLEKARASLRDAPRPRAQRFIESAILRAVALPPAVSRIGAGLLARLHRIGAVRTMAGGAGRGDEVGRGSQGRGGVAGHGGKAGRGGGAERGGGVGRLRAAARILAAMAPRPVSLPAVMPPRGERLRRVGFLEGCVNRWVFGNVNLAGARLLALAGSEVLSPPGQRCCGALHLHAGELDGARRLARANIVAFEQAGDLDAIVVTAAGCGSAMKEYGRLFEGDTAWEARARRFASRTRDALELLEEVGLPPALREVPGRVAYHDACHLAHAQGIRSGPRALLSSIPGLSLVPLADADRCCGSAGIYNILHPEVASAILERKLERLRESGADTVCAANPGCLLQIAAGARAAGFDLRAAHPLEIIADALLPAQR